MKSAALGLALALAGVAPASAAVVLFDNFDTENGGTFLANAPLANFDVTDGTIDIVASGDFSIDCVGGSGACVDLDGSTSEGATITTKLSYAFAAGDTVTLSILLSGNQRDAAADEFSFGFSTSVPTLFNDVIITGPFGPVPINVGDLGPGSFLGSGRPTFTNGLVGAGEPFTPYSISFVAGNAGTLTAFVATASADNQGPVLDNFLLDITGVPEASTWAMMIAGFGLVGAVMRRRVVAA